MCAAPPAWLQERGWDLNMLQFPPSIHIAVTMAHTPDGIVEAFLKDLAECSAPLLASPNEKVC